MAPPLSLVAALEHTRILTYFHFSSLALLVFDYFLTFPQEVSLIWPSRLTVIKALFLFTRYSPFVELGMIIHYHLQQHPKSETCHFIYQAGSWLFYVGTGSTELMLTLRTWAVWNRDRRLSIGLSIFFVLCWASMIKLVIVSVKPITVMPLKSPALLGCMVTKGSTIISAAWCVLLVYEAGIFLLMLIKAVHCYKMGGRSRLFDIVFGNGLLYYMYLFILALINVIISQVMPPSLSVVLASTERVLHSILGCRVVLDIRGEVSDKRQSGFANANLVSSPQFRDRNITLDHSDTVVCSSEANSSV